MANLTKQEIIDLDKFIDNTISSQPIFKRAREIALMHLLKVFEDYVRLGAKGNRDIIKLGIDGMKFAVQWIYEYCRPLGYKTNYDTKDEIYDEAYKLLMLAKEYSMVWDFLTLLHRGQAVGIRNGDTIALSPANQVTPLKDVADHFISSPDSPEMKETQSLGKYKEEIVKRAKNIELQIRGKNKIKYSFTDENFNELRKYLTSITQPLWELDLSWDFGGYTIGQLKDFWLTLLSLVLINQTACITSGIVGGALDSTVIIKNRTRFIRELSKQSGLSEEIVSLILNDLLYNSEINEPGQKRADVIYQPIFLLPDDLVAISSYLVSNSNAERNTWDLISILRSSIHSKLSTLKEAKFLKDLSSKLSGYGLKTAGTVKFDLEGQKGDIDLLIYDEKNNFLLGCELKWLIPPDRTTDVYYFDLELLKGMKQANLDKKWLLTKPEKLLEILGIDKALFEQTEIETIVLSKNNLGSSWLKDLAPIINERLIDWILGDPHKRNLKTLWIVGNEKRYLPIAGKHFEEPDVEISFAGIKFISKNFGLRVIQIWRPVDIDLKGI